MPASVIRVTHVTCGDPNAPVAFFAADAASLVRFETTPGQDPARVYSVIIRLWEGAINPDYDPLTGCGTFLTLDRDPDIASYEFSEGASDGPEVRVFKSVTQQGWNFLPEDVLRTAKARALAAPGSEQLRQLAIMEGDLMVMAALQRLHQGEKCFLSRQMYAIAAHYVDFMHDNLHGLTPAADSLARRVFSAACDISAPYWHLSLDEMAYVYREAV